MKTITVSLILVRFGFYGILLFLSQWCINHFRWSHVKLLSLVTLLFRLYCLCINCHDERKVLWDSISDLGCSQVINGKPWIVLGDFNQTLSPQEHSLNTSSRVDSRMRLFRECLLEADLQDLNYRGNTFSWWNKSKVLPVAKKLDRALVNDEWGNSFPTAVASFGSPGFSDHAPISISLSISSPSIKRPFRFF